MVCTVGPRAPATGRGGIHRGRRDPLGARPTGRQFPDRHLSDRRGLPAFAVGGQTALASHATARPEGTWPGGGAGDTVCLQRHVEALSASEWRGANNDENVLGASKRALAT